MPDDRLQRLESKRDIQARGEVSPDDADAFVLTFALPVAPVRPEDQEESYQPRSTWG